MLKVLHLVTLLCLALSGFAQIKNNKLDELPPSGDGLEVSISVNPRNTKNIVAVAGQGNVYITFDGGANWQKSSVQSSLGSGPNPVVMFDGKGALYYLHLGGPEKKSDKVICHASKDGGKSWDDGSIFGVNPSKNLASLWAAIDEKENIYATWTQFDELGSTNENCASTILMSRSSNGRKWSTPLVISQNTGDCSTGTGSVIGAMPTVGADGKIMITWSHQNGIYLDRSYDGTFWLTNDITLRKRDKNTTARLGQTGKRVSTVLDRSKMVTRGTLYVTWQEDAATNKGTEVMVIKSANFGDIVTSPTRIFPEGGIDADQFLPALAVDHYSGIVYVLYYNTSIDTGLTDIYIAYSVNAGNSFKSVKVSDSSFQFDPSVTTIPYVQLSAVKGVIAPVWVGTEKGAPVIWTATINQDELLKTAN